MTTTALQRTTMQNGSAENQEPINLEWPERYISIAAGVKLAFSGLTHIFKSPFTSIVKMGAGGYLLNRGVTGHCELYTKLGKTLQNPLTQTSAHHLP